MEAIAEANVYPQEDGSVIVDLGIGVNRGEPINHDDNLALYLDESILDRIGSEVLEGIEDDLRSRSEWEQTLKNGLDLLGLKLEKSSSLASGEGSVSRVYSQVLLESVIRYQANFLAEMLPSSGPVKVIDRGIIGDGLASGRVRDEAAEAFERDFNYYLTVIDRGFFSDTDRMAFYQAITGNGFKKQYICPISGLPISRSIPAHDLIVSNDATCLGDAMRVTHRTLVSKSLMKRLQWIGKYRRIELAEPIGEEDEVGKKIRAIEGRDVLFSSGLSGVGRHVVYECYVDLDIPGYEHRDEFGVETGLLLPYVVSIDKDSRKVLEIRRNWDEGDTEYRRRMRIVHYPLIPGLGFYAYGFLHLLGNSVRAATGLERLLIDAGMFSNFPGFLVTRHGTKQRDTNIVVSPGQGREVETGGRPIRDVVMELPYKQPSNVLFELQQYLENSALRMAGAMLLPIAESKADVPVGTVLASIEQALKPISAIHRRNHQAQMEEFLNLKELFAKRPYVLSIGSRNPMRLMLSSEEIMDMRLIPASDPNVPSHAHRLLVAAGLVQLLNIPGAAGILDAKEIVSRALRTMNVDGIDKIFRKEEPQSADAQAEAALVALKAKEVDLLAREQELKREIALRRDALKAEQMRASFESKEKDREVKEKIAALKLLEQELRNLRKE